MVCCSYKPIVRDDNFFSKSAWTAGFRYLLVLRVTINMLCCMNKLSLLDNGCNYLETTEHHLTCLPTLLLRRTGLFLSNWRSFPQEMVYLKRRDHIKSRCILVLQYCISPRILSRSYLTVILCRSEQNDPCLCSIYLLYIFSHWGIS